MLSTTTRFLEQVSVSGSSPAVLEELVKQGESFTDSLLWIATTPCAESFRLLACTILKVVVSRGAPLSLQARATLLSRLQPAQGPLGSQFALVLAQLAVRSWPVRLLDFPPFARAEVLRALRLAKVNANALQEQAQLIVDCGSGGEWRLLRQAAKCGAALPFARLHGPEHELLRLFAASRDVLWAPVKASVAQAASRHVLDRPKLCCNLLVRCEATELAAKAALCLLGAGHEREGGALWHWVSGRAPGSLTLLSGAPPKLAALALLHCDTEETRLAAGAAGDALWQLTAPLLGCGGEPALRLLQRWSAEVPPARHAALAAWLSARPPSPAAVRALASLVCDARFAGPRLPAYAEWAAGLSCQDDDELAAALGALCDLAAAGLRPGGPAVAPLLERAWRSGHPLARAQALRLAAALGDGGGLGAVGPALVRAGLACEFLREEVLALWLQLARGGGAAAAELLPLLLDQNSNLLARHVEAWDVLACCAPLLAARSSVPPLPLDADPMLQLRRLALLEMLLASTGRLCADDVPALTRHPHAAVRERAVGLLTEVRSK